MNNHIKAMILSANSQGVKEPSSRNSVIDNARGIGILLVVIGHAPGISKSMHDLIFSFHVPLFFFLSGFSFKESSLSGTFLSQIKKLAKSLLIPFSFFWFFSYLYWLPTHMNGGNKNLYTDYTLLTPFFGFLKSSSSSMPMNPALWFFTALFLMSAIYWLIRSFCRDANAATLFTFVISTIAATYLIDIDGFSYWNFTIALSCIFFYALGNLLNDILYKFDSEKYSPQKLLLSLCFLVPILLMLSEINSPVDISNKIFGKNIILFFISGITGFLTIIVIAKLIKKNKVLMYFSKNSIVLFSVHMVAFRVLTAILILFFNFTRVDLNKFYFNFLYLFWAIFLLIPIVYVLRKKFTLVLGGRK